MSYHDQLWNSEKSSRFTGPRHFPNRETLNGQHDNSPLPNQRTSQVGPSPHEQFLNYAPMSGVPYNSVGNRLRIPQNLQYQNPPQSLPPQHQMQPQPSLPPQHQMPPLWPSPPSLTPQQQGLQPQHQMPPPQHQMLIPQHQMPPPQHQMLPPQHQMPPPQHQMPPPQQQMPPRLSPASLPSQHQIPLPQHQLPPPRHQMPPPRHQIPPPRHQMPPPNSQLRPPVVPSNFSPYHNVVIPSHTIPGAGQIPPSPQAMGNIHGALSGLEMNSQPPPMKMHSSFQQMPNYQPFPRIPTHGGTPGRFQLPGTIINQHEIINNQQLYMGSNKSEASEKDLGSERLENWLQKIGKSKKYQLKGPSKQKSSDQIWKPVNQLRGMTHLITTMSTKLQELQEGAASASTSEWKNMTLDLETLKGQYINLESLLEESSVERIAKKLLQRRSKRARIKQARERKYEEQQKGKEDCDQKSQQIDRWQERLRAKIKEENLRKSRKAAADHTLSKVTREIQDASRLIETMLALQKLRLIRRDAAEKRGDTDLGESRQSFEQKIADMTRLVQSQLECYKEEEAKLKQIIKSEQDKDTEKDRLAQIEKEKQKQMEEDEELQRMLFGEQEELTVSDPRFPYVQYYRQAESSLQAFVQIRHEWDSFLVPETNPASSAIPSSWVFPEPPSSTTWATALK